MQMPSVQRKLSCYHVSFVFLTVILIFAHSLLLARTDNLVATTPGSTYVTGPFNQEVEFPNYFLPSNYSTLSATEKSQALKQVKGELSAALKTLFNNMTVPVVLPGENKVTNVAYFPYIINEVNKITGNQGTVIPSGGVVRTAVAYIYDEIFLQIRNNTKLSAKASMQEMAQGQFTYQGEKLKTHLSLLLICEALAAIWMF